MAASQKKRATLRGMTWDHRRAIDPLMGTAEMFAAAHPEITIEWSSRPLHGFEFTPVAELAQTYDLIILDHPFCGDIAASLCLMPVDGILTPELRKAFVGPSLETYFYGGRTWAMPVDAACQVAVSRPDLMDGLDAAAPKNWAELMALGARAAKEGQKLAIGLRGVHSLMTFFTLCANQGHPCAVDPGQKLVDRDIARAALAAIRALLVYCPPQALDWNSIALHDVMTARDDLVYCPAVYCYATYAEADMRRPLRFLDMPGLAGTDPRGSTIGGAGVGVSVHCTAPDAALDYVSYLMAPETQRGFALHHGQPAAVSVWEDAEINARFGDCYRATRATIENAWIRPRYQGYLALQAAGGTLIEQHLRGALAEAELLDRLEELHRAGARVR